MFSNYSYRELQQALKGHRDAGLTTIALNSKKVELIAELERIETELISCPAADAIAVHAETVREHQATVVVDPQSIPWTETAIAWFHLRVLPVLPRRIAIGFGMFAGLREELAELFGFLRAAMERTDQALADFRANAG